MIVLKCLVTLMVIGHLSTEFCWAVVSDANRFTEMVVSKTRLMNDGTMVSRIGSLGIAVLWAAALWLVWR